MAVASDVLGEGRDAFDRRAWESAYTTLSSLDAEQVLGPDDLDRLAAAAHLTGRDGASVEAWQRAHAARLDAGDPAGAARCGFWIAFVLLHRGEAAQGSGWLARAQRVLDDADTTDTVERGYLLFPVGLQQVAAGDAAAALATFGQVVEIGDRFGDEDLTTLARHGQGRALIRLGEPVEGVARLDEAMVAVTADRISPILAGDIFCSVIEACQELADVERARAWTGALGRWCAAQPDLVPYRGQYLVHRSELRRLQGDWAGAVHDVEQAVARLSDPPGQPALGMAWYQRAELHRVRGDLRRAEAAYRRAGEHGRDPQPGLALLRLAQGRAEAAAAMLHHRLEQVADDVGRAGLLPASVEALLAVGDRAAARRAAEALTGLAAAGGAPLPRARAAHATGAVLLAEGDPTGALAELRRAWATWSELEMPYEAARTRVLVALAGRDLGDRETARCELDAARATFRRLGATPQLAHVARLSRRTAASGTGGLTRREMEVLRLVAAGRTNREIADELAVTDRTVARHVSSILTKLGVSSRAAATAYAYEHDLM